jgi:hypothetical protein
VLSGGSLTVRLGGPMIYKLCVAPAGSAASLDAHFTYVSSVKLTVTISPPPPPPPPPPTSSGPSSCSPNSNSSADQSGHHSPSDQS